MLWSFIGILYYAPLLCRTLPYRRAYIYFYFYKPTKFNVTRWNERAKELKAGGSEPLDERAKEL